jgi:hypothetical protein
MPHLHSLQSYTFVDYNHLLHSYTGWLLSYRLLSQIITHFASSHFPCLSPIETSLVGLLLKTDCLDISVPLINLQSYEPGESCVASGHCVYRRCLGNERAAVWRHRGLLCGRARCRSARHGTARHGANTASPTAAQRVFGRELFTGRCLETSCATNNGLICHNIFLRWCAGIVPYQNNLTRSDFNTPPEKHATHTVGNMLCWKSAGTSIL